VTGTTTPDLLSPEFTQDPYPVYRDLRESGPAHRTIVKTLTVELHAWVITGYDQARALLADQRLSKDASGLPGIVERHKVRQEPVALANFASMLFSDPPDHTRLRRIIGRAFTMRRVQQLRPWIEQATARLLDRIETGAVTDAVDAVALPLPISVIGALLGVPPERHDDFRGWNATFTSVDATMADKQRAHVAATAYLKGLIEHKRAEPADDMVSTLAHPSGDEPALDDTELLSTIFLVMNAGYETTASMIGNAIHALVDDPGLRHELRAAPERLPRAVEEFLRHESPLNLATVRYTLEPVPVGDVVIPAGEIVFVSLAAANRDGGRFAEPDRLDVGRAENSHLSFGHGIHHCVGAPLARLEGEIALRGLLERFAHWELAVSKSDLRWRNSLQFRSLERLPVRFT